MNNENKNVIANHSIVGLNSGLVLFQKENGTAYFRNAQKSTIVNGERKFDSLLKWINQLKHETGAEISIDVKNTFDELKAEYEETEFLIDAPVRKPEIDGFLEVNGEMVTNYVILNRCKTAIINNIALRNVLNYTGHIQMVVEYSSDKIHWKEYCTHDFNNPKPIYRTKEFRVLHYRINRGDDSGYRVSLNKMFFRNSSNLVLTSIDLYDASKYEWGGEIYYDNNIEFHFSDAPTNFPKELTINNKVILSPPHSSNHWYANLYGYVKDPINTGKNVVRGTHHYWNDSFENSENSVIPLDYNFECNKEVEGDSSTLFVRLRLKGNGTLTLDGRQNFLISATGSGIVREEYIQNVDEEKGIYIERIEGNTLIPTRDLFHLEAKQTPRYSLPEQKNHKQTIALNIVMNGGATLKFFQETYTDHFIHNIKTLDPTEKEFLLFESNDMIVPTVKIPSKIKQLLYKKDDKYINKRIIDDTSNLSVHGYEIIDGIKKYNSNCEPIDGVISKDLEKILFVVEKNIRFANILLDTPINTLMKDLSGKLICKGKTLLSNETRVNEGDIINKIKYNKTFYKMSMIIYSEYTSDIEDLIVSLYGGNSTPQDVFLVCKNPNESNIELCHFNKTSLGAKTFLNNTVKAIRNNVGLQFDNIEELLKLVDEYINSCIDKEKHHSLNNSVGINIYDFTDTTINKEHINRYGYYVNYINKNFKKTNDIKLHNTSVDNTIEGVIQYDVGSVFLAEFDLTNTFKESNIEDIVEERNIGKSISITHLDNIAYKFIVGEEEIKVFDRDGNTKKFSYAINKVEDKTILRLTGTFKFTKEYIGYNHVIVNIKQDNGIETSYISKFLVDYKEPKVTKFTIKSTNDIEEIGYNGNKDKNYTKDNFITVGINLADTYNFEESNYKILIKHSKFKDYKIERELKGVWSSKLLTFNIDDIKNLKNIKQKLKFGDWICELIRTDHNHTVKTINLNIPLHIQDAINFYATPVDPNLDDIDNDGLQQGEDIYIEFGFTNSEYFKIIRDWIYFCKEVRFISNKENFTEKPEYFTFENLDSLKNVTEHNKVEDINKKTSLRWFISGTSEDNSNKYLKPIANLAGDSKKTKEIKIQFLMWDDSIVETIPVIVGETGKITAPIVMGSEDHYQKLLKVEAKMQGKPFSDLTDEDRQNAKNKVNSLGQFNYGNQQLVNDNRLFVFYSDLIEIQFDFCTAEYFTITQANNISGEIPVVKDGKVRYIIDNKAIDENGRGSIIVKGYIKLSDGLTISSNERVISFIRKKKPSIVQTGDDYTKYVQYEVDEKNYYNLKTVIQSKIILENMNNNYSSKWINHITADLVDVDKRTVIAYGPKIQFYDGFIPQRFVFDSGLTSDELSALADDERIEIEATKKYKELEKLLNEQLFSTGKHEGQTFYLRFKSVEVAKDYYGEDKEIYGEYSFYPIKFSEALKELLIIPASGVIVKEEDYIENYYTYKNKVSFVLESNNAEYFMYRTDRSAAFQKVYPKSVGYTKTVKLVVPTYDVGNHFLEVKQKAVGETESNVYSVLVEKINPVSPPMLVGDYVTDENPIWSINPIDNAYRFQYSIISDEKEHTKKTIDAVQYEMKVEPEIYLDNGYHILQARTIDKINNYSEYSYFLTRKIGRPIPNKINGQEKTSNNYIEWSWESQYFEGVRNYEVEINGAEKNTIPASLDGYNEYNLRHFQGRELTDGSYEIRVWSINELGNKSYTYSNFLTYKGSKIKELAYEFYKFEDDYTNKLECKIITDDPAIKYYEYEISKNINGNVADFTGILTTNNKTIPFILPNGDKIRLEDGQYYFSLRGVNNIGEKTEFLTTSFYYKESMPERPFIYYEKSVKTTNPVIFVKETGNEMIYSIEIKIGDKPFEKVKNNVWRPNYAINLGINNIVFRITDYAGNQAEYSDFIEVSSKGVNLFQGDYVADMNNPLLTFDFNMHQMSNFSHSNFRVQQDTLGIDTIITVRNANTIEIPLSNGSEKYPDGNYIFTVKLYDESTKDFDYIVDFFTVTIDSKKPYTPYFLNNGYDQIEYNRMYTKNRSPKWIWQTKDIQNIKEYIVDLYQFSKEEGDYIPYGNRQFINYSTDLIGQFQTPDELKDGTYKLTVHSVGLNNLNSDYVSFFIVVKNSLPKPPCFDLDEPINRKYENRNSGISWLWKDINNSENKLIKYKIKINDEEFSDEIGFNITHYEETRKLQDGPNKLTVIGCDKAGNWSSSNETTAIQLGNNFLSLTKIIDTVTPEVLTDRDVIVNILDHESFEVSFKDKINDDEYLLFELFTLNQNNEEIFLVKGNTLKENETNIYLLNNKVIPGISLGELTENSGYCEIRNTINNQNSSLSLYFTNLLTNEYLVRIYVADYSGNISTELIKGVSIQDVSKIKPSFILPKEIYTNNSTIMFQWVLDKPNIKEWEYQLVTPYNNSKADLSNYDKWKTLSNSIFTLNNIPKIIAGNKADGEYTLYVRAVFEETVFQEETRLEMNKRSDIGSITVVLDREAPQGINFTNKHYTTDNSVLRWSWEYTGEGDTASGVYVSFNPNLPMEDWEKLEDRTEYSSFKERQDGIYTIYIKTFDKAGNINDTIFSNTITIDRVPPFKPIINGGSNINVNFIPTIEWENDLNYYKFVWIILTLEEFNRFKKVYDDIINIENYTLKNDDWKHLFSKDKDNVNPNNVHKKLAEFHFNTNDPLSTNFITINSSDNKFGISEEGEYVFILTGYDQNLNWAEDFEYQFIRYDLTAPDMNKLKFISPKYVITSERRPEWIWKTPNDVTRCEYFLEKNGYNDGGITGNLYKEENKNVETYEYKFVPEYNLTQGNYNLVVDCYDASGNLTRISKSILVEGNTTVFEEEYFDIILPGINNRLRCKMNKYSDTYTIINIDTDENSVLTYKESKNLTGGYKIFELGVTELMLDENYDFNITSYKINTK